MRVGDNSAETACKTTTVLTAPNSELYARIIIIQTRITSPFPPPPFPWSRRPNKHNGLPSIDGIFKYVCARTLSYIIPTTPPSSPSYSHPRSVFPRPFHLFAPLRAHSLSLSLAYSSSPSALLLKCADGSVGCPDGGHERPSSRVQSVF